MKDSSAIRYYLQTSEEKKLFYYAEDCLEEILKGSYIITKIEGGRFQLSIHAHKPGKNLTLRALEEADYENGFQFVRDHASEFREQISWNGETIHDMAKGGLTSGKWKAYGYFDEEGKLAAYADYKLRADGKMEIGIVVTDEAYRGMGLAAGLIWLLRLKNADRRACSGTYEENEIMRKAFEKTGFEPRIFTDSKTGKETIYVRDRFDPKFPGDREKLTNSVYYKAEKLHTK